MSVILAAWLSEWMDARRRPLAPDGQSSFIETMERRQRWRLPATRSQPRVVAGARIAADHLPHRGVCYNFQVSASEARGSLAAQLRAGAGRPLLANLKGADLHRVNLEGADLGGADLEGADLEGANLEGANLQGANLQGANLHLARLQRVVGEGADMQGADLEGADLHRANFHAADLSRTDLRWVDLRWANLEEAILRGAQLEGANLEEAILRGARLEGANLRRVDFLKAELQRANLGGATLEEADLHGADARWARFRRADLRRTNLQRSNLERADLRLANLQQANLQQANLLGAGLQEADFRGAYLQQANLEGASLEGADFEGARLEGVRLINTEIGEGAIHAHSVSEAIVDWRTVARSLRVDGLQVFLTRTGMPEVLAIYMISSLRTIDEMDLFTMLQSVFLSYGRPDGVFAERLRDALIANGVKTWFFPRDATPGARLHRHLQAQINAYDRIILCCSVASLQRAGVLHEIEEVLEREQAEGGSEVLIPILLEPIFDSGQVPPPWWPVDKGHIYIALSRRVAADFRGAMDDPKRWSDQLGRVLMALRKKQVLGS